MDELIADKIIHIDGKTFLLHIFRSYCRYEDACDYGLKLGNNWRMINIKDNMMLHNVFQLNFWIYDDEAIRNDKQFGGRRVHCGYIMDPVMIAPYDYKTNSVFIKEIV